MMLLVMLGPNFLVGQCGERYGAVLTPTSPGQSMHHTISERSFVVRKRGRVSSSETSSLTACRVGVEEVCENKTNDYFGDCEDVLYPVMYSVLPRMYRGQRTQTEFNLRGDRTGESTLSDLIASFAAVEFSGGGRQRPAESRSNVAPVLKGKRLHSTGIYCEFS